MEITKNQAMEIIGKFMDKGKFDTNWEDVQYVVKCDLLEIGRSYEEAEEFINNDKKVLKYVKRNWGHIL